MCTNVSEHAVQNFAAIFSVFFFGRNFKDVWDDPPHLSQFANLVLICCHIQQVITRLLLQKNVWNLQDT